MMASCIGRYFNAFKATNKRSPHVLVLVHRTEIHTQNHNKFSLVCPNIATSEITASRKSLKGNIHFGMVQTVNNLLPDFEKSDVFFDLIVIDESHHAVASTYKDIIEWNLKRNPSASLFGVTATPNRGDKVPLADLFDNFYQITTDYLIKSHYLTRPQFIDLSPTFETKKGAEKGHLEKNIKDDEKGNEIIESMLMDYLLYKEDGKTIIFAPSHRFCEKIYDTLKEFGRSPAYLGLNLDDNTRKAELEKFENGECTELINVDICTEGYDYPPIRNLVDFDTNGTHSQWVQKVGRVLRTCPGKTSCTVLDFGGNVELYPGGIETDVNLEGALKKKGGQKLCERNFFRNEQTDSSQIISQENTSYTPYHLPTGFESINDLEYGIVFVACGRDKDVIIVPKDNEYTLYTTNKNTIEKHFDGSFAECIEIGRAYIGEIDVTQKPISNIQISLLAPEYPTNTLNWHGANCCICFKTWKGELKNAGISDKQN